METPAQKLCELVNKKYLLFTQRGNSSIKIILEVLMMRGKNRVLIQDEGGWLTYSKYLKKLEMEKIELKTDNGLVNDKDLDKYKDYVLLINSMPGYCCLQDMEIILKACKKNNIFLVNDASGSIGTEEAWFGDVVFGSFGNAKPIDMGHGGFIATDDEKIYKELSEMNMFLPDDDFLDALGKKLDNLEDRLCLFQIKRVEVIDDLKIHDIVHKDGGGINVIVKFNNDAQKEDIISYCGEQKLEYTLCPRYIRIKERAVSIEIKRLKEESEADIKEEYDEVD